MTESNSA